MTHLLALHAITYLRKWAPIYAWIVGIVLVACLATVLLPRPIHTAVESTVGAAILCATLALARAIISHHQFGDDATHHFSRDGRSRPKGGLFAPATRASVHARVSEDGFGAAPDFGSGGEHTLTRAAAMPSLRITFGHFAIDAFSFSLGLPELAAINLDGLIRRIIDMVIALFFLVFLAPVLLLVALAIKLDDGGPVFFASTRIGRHGRPFRLLKFRSMRSEQAVADWFSRSPDARLEWATTHKFRHDPRVTRVGYFLRRSSVDELPQLLNILAGHMSFVGPRPIYEAHSQFYGRRLRYYAAMKPGLIGLWPGVSLTDDRLRQQAAVVHYARRRSWVLDLRILLANVSNFFRPGGGPQARRPRSPLRGL